MKGFMSVLLTVSVVAVAFGNKCPSEQETNWEIEKLLPHKECDKFYKCTYGKPVEQGCPAGLQFNVDSLQCDWDYNVDCRGRIVPGSESKPDPKSSEETKESDVPEASSESNVDSSASDSSEENKPTEKEELVPVVPAPEEGSASGETIEFQENGCPVDNSIPWLAPHEKYCNLFYFCVLGQKQLRECSPKLHFNAALQVCDWPAAAGCAKSLDKHNLSQYINH